MRSVFNSDSVIINSFILKFYIYSLIYDFFIVSNGNISFSDLNINENLFSLFLRYNNSFYYDSNSNNFSCKVLNYFEISLYFGISN